MTQPTDDEESGPGLRSFGLNSAHAHRVLRPEPEGVVSLRVMSERELARQKAEDSRSEPDQPSPRT